LIHLRFLCNSPVKESSIYNCCPTAIRYY